MLRYLGDVESDFSAIHRIDDIWSMDGPKFFRFAQRLPAYKGAMRMRAEAQAMQEQKRNGGRDPSDVITVGAGELNKIEGLGITENRGDGTPWISVEQATD